MEVKPIVVFRWAPRRAANAMARLVILGSRGTIWAAELFGHEKVADFHSKLMCGRPFGGEPSERNTLPSIIEPRDDAVRRIDGSFLGKALASTSQSRRPIP